MKASQNDCLNEAGNSNLICSWKMVTDSRL